MTETEPEVRLIRFGNFEVDLRSGELRKDGAKLKFGGQPFQVLSILLERPGDVVTREELQKRLWPDTFVDVDHNLNTAINKIREVLGDSAESPHFVETLPRRGYRFIGELERPVEVVIHAVPVEPDRGWRSRKLQLIIAAGVLAVSVIALAAGVVYRWYRQQRPQEQMALAAVPFTALPRQAISPAFSPDGSRIALAWNGDPATGTKGFDLYVKALGSETLLRLTQHPSEWISPAWSPDGTQIAFHRVAGADTGIYVVPTLGGPERKLRSTRTPWRVFVNIPFSGISWSPDGRWIAFADMAPEEESARLFLLSTETLETRQIPINPKCMGEGLPSFSHSGESLAYWCSLNGGDKATLSFLQLPDGKPRTIASFQAWPTGLTWSADDKRLICSFWESFHELGEVTVANGSTKRLAFLGAAAQPSVSTKGDTLAFGATYTSSNIWRRDLLHPEAPAAELIPSSRGQFDAQYSPDGKRITFGSFRSGVEGVWISNEDGSNLVQISNPAQPSGSPQWSPDGNKIAFDSRPLDRWEIYVADATEGIPKKLVTNISEVVRPHWSRDGKWIYFRSIEAGRMGVYRCPASGGDAIALSKDIDGFSPQESFDERTIFFASHESKPMLKKVLSPGQPATESEVDGLPRLSNYSLWSLSPGGIYFVPADAPKSVRYFDFASKQIRTIFEADKDFGSGLSVSPDGRWIMYSLVGDVNSDIMLVDHFQ
jgi:Tol biopolymer transport system component/DNA-binding winged helix-turn-helix (wHTH) protein